MWMGGNFVRFFIDISFTHLQGRKTFRIVHDIVNRCNDLEIVHSVWRFLYRVFEETKILSLLSFFPDYSNSWANYRIKQSIATQKWRVDYSPLIGLYYTTYDISSILKQVNSIFVVVISDDWRNSHIPNNSHQFWWFSDE